MAANSAMSSAPAGPPKRRRLALHWQILLGLVVGAAVGLAANAMAQRPVVAQTADACDLDRNGIDDRLDWWVINVTDPLGKIFLRLLFMVVVPLVFSALALSVVQMGDWRRLGRVGLGTLAYTVALSSTAVLLGVLLVHLIQPGRRLEPQQAETLRAQYAARAGEALSEAKRAKPLKDLLLDLIPENPLQEMVGALDGSSKGNGILAVMSFALIVGIAMTFVPERTRTLASWLDGLGAVAMAVIGFAMHLAPYGVACLVFGVAARLGWAVFVPLAWFVCTVFLGLAMQLVLVYSLVVWRLGRISPWIFFWRISDAMLTALGTASSSATLPTALRVAEEELRLPPEVSRFVLTLGATSNQNGTALYEAVVVLFLAQVFHVELSLSQQLTVVLMAILAGVGTAGVPGAALPLIVVLLQTVGVPGEAIGLVLGIDRLLDMGRAMLNVTGDLVIAVCLSGHSPRRTLAEGRGG